VSKSLNVFGELIADTFQEARARWLFWGLFGLSTLLVLLFLLVLQIDLAESALSFMVVAPTFRHIFNMKHFVGVSYSWVSIALYVWGTFLAIFASAGLIPGVLEAGRISLLLAKPLARTTLLMGRYVGNVLVVLLNNVYLVLSVWLILGLKTHIWEARFLLAIPITIFIFAVLLCVVVLVGVLSESAALSVMVPMALMLLSALLAQRQLVVRLLSSEWSRQVWLFFYWVMPKVWDLGNAMRQIILLDRHADWLTPVWTSALFGIVTLTSAVYLFQKRDF
jgi:ABC-type transport system involved in multi-copper enzyme maturation permease subunit